MLDICSPKKNLELRERESLTGQIPLSQNLDSCFIFLFGGLSFF